jgi:hypothetical protein
MTSVSKFRKLSVIAMIILVVFWLLSMAALWNSLHNADVTNEGWIVVFMCVVLIVGGFLFYVSYMNTNDSQLEKLKKDAYESGKSEVWNEIEAKKQTDTKQKEVIEDSNKAIESILSGIHGVRNENSLCNKLLISIAREVEFVQGVMYVKNKKDAQYYPVGEYALTERKPLPFKDGENLNGQVAVSKSPMILYDVPENYFIISSGLGSSQPRYLLIAPVLLNNETIAVLELAAFKKPDENTSRILEKVLSEVGHKLNKFITD